MTYKFYAMCAALPALQYNDCDTKIAVNITKQADAIATEICKAAGVDPHEMVKVHTCTPGMRL